jgi:UMF1 family MFS transporter
MSRRSIVSWCLYDFANSIYAAVIPATIWAAYYTDAIVGNDAGQGDLWWGRAISLAMVVVAVTSPFMGALADRASWRRRLLVTYTLGAIGGTLAMALVRPGDVLFGFAVTVLATIGFEGVMVFYNAYLPDLAPVEHRGRLSGLGYAVGYVGSVAGLLAVMPLVQASRFGSVFIAVALGYFIFAIPAFVWLPRPVTVNRPPSGGIADSLRITKQTLQEMLRIPGLRWFMLAYFLYIDGVNTTIYFSAIFARGTLGFAMSELISLYLVVQVAALLGALAWAAPTDRLGARKVILLLILQWSLVALWAFFVSSKSMFYVLAGCAGTGLGAIQAASRAYLATYVPVGSEGRYFGFFALTGKSASIFGPVIFGAVSAASGGNQRHAVLSVLVFILLGGLFMLATPRSRIRPLASVDGSGCLG